MGAPENASSHGLCLTVILVLFLGAAVGGYFAWDAVSDLQRENRQLARDAAFQQGEAASQTERRIETETQLQSLTRTSREQKNDLDALRDRLESAKKELAEATSAANGLRRDLEALRQAAKAPAPAASDANGALAELRQALTAEQGRAAALAEELQALRLKQGAPDQDRAAWEKERSELRREIEKVRDELAAASSELASREERLEAERRDIEATYEKLTANLQDELRAKKLTIEKCRSSLTLTVVDKLFFAFGSARVSPQGEEILAAVAEQLRQADPKRIYVVGHADDVPVRRAGWTPYRNNWELSANRAAAAVVILARRSGLDPARFTVAGRSFYQPEADNATADGRAANRRVEIILGDLDL